MLKEAFKSIYMVENVFHSLGFGSPCTMRFCTSVFNRVIIILNHFFHHDQTQWFKHPSFSSIFEYEA
ncbi:hypothetical protein VTP01DRAFT_6712 [Rhizomucor pusillus]|uniref:uncharacterized protein n=1 Tax=Rhizomucor pusillus TaxID=4840 RepID=UPI0037433714